MGLLGFVNVMFGLGSLAKNAIDESISDATNREKAERLGRSTYSVNGYKTRSTKTGNDCWYKDDPDTSHQWLIDLKTGGRIEDLTDTANKRKTEENKRKAYAQGIKFYRTAMFDCNPRWWSDVYVNDDMPGKYFARIDLEHNAEYFYYEGELEKPAKPGRCKVDWKIRCNVYDKNGNLVRSKEDWSNLKS